MIELDERLIGAVATVINGPELHVGNKVEPDSCIIFDKCHEIIITPFLSPNSCDQLLQILGKSADGFAMSQGKFGAPEIMLASVSKAIEHDLILAVSRYLGPLIWKFWRIFPGAFSPPFVIRYAPGAKTGLPEHHDFEADVSLSIALDANFNGGGLYFPRQDHFIPHNRPGTAVIFPGKVTHLHRACDVTKGCRHVVTVWCRHTEGVN